MKDFFKRRTFLHHPVNLNGSNLFYERIFDPQAYALGVNRSALGLGR